MAGLFADTEWELPPSRCEICGELEAECVCPPPPQTYAAPQTQTARLAIEKRKRGKQMTVVRGLAAAENDLPALLTRLKTHCGAGGAVKDDLIEIQGNHLNRIRDALAAMGYQVRS